jgi:hypothetical protein
MKESLLTRNTRLIRQKLSKNWHSFNNWFINTPERAVLEAYEAAQAIQKIENEQFGGQKISAEVENYSANVMAFWQGNLNRNLTTIKVRLAEFQLGIKLVDISDPNILEKLKFIDEVTGKYNQEYNQFSKPIQQAVEDNLESNLQPSQESVVRENPITQKTGVFPRSIGRTFNKITNDFTPTAEQEFVKNYRSSRNQTRRAIKFLLLLIIIPLLTQHFSKELLINPILKNVVNENNSRIFLNLEMEEKAIRELNKFEQKLQFQRLLHQAPELTPENIETQVKTKATEIADRFRSQTTLAMNNILADLISLLSFAMVINFSKKDIVFLQSLLDKIVYGLSDSAKAFLIILITDIFVGFHSPHGWEILLESFANHLGLPASRNAIFLFIATFPVILDTIFKYWIFRYLSRLSPSALATLKEMDE